MTHPPVGGVLTLKVRGLVGLGASLFLTVGVAIVGTLMAGRKETLPGTITGATVLVIGIVVSLLRARRRVVVGDDGVRIVRMLSSRFIPYAAIRGIQRPEAIDLSAGSSKTGRGYYFGLRLDLVSGGGVDIPVVGLPEPTVTAAAARIHAGSVHARAAGARPTLDRAGRTVAAWRDALAKDIQSVDFRSRSRTLEELDAVLADPMARAEDRVGAALALHAAGVEGAVERIRRAAATSANGALGVALDAAATGTLDDEVLNAAAEGGI